MDMLYLEIDPGGQWLDIIRYNEEIHPDRKQRNDQIRSYLAKDGNMDRLRAHWGNDETKFQERLAAAWASSDRSDSLNCGICALESALRHMNA